MVNIRPTPEQCAQFQEIAKRLKDMLRQYDDILLTMPAPTENVGLAKAIAMYAGDAARDTMQTLEYCRPDSIPRIGYVKEKLDSALHAYQGLVHNETIPMDVQ